MCRRHLVFCVWLVGLASPCLFGCGRSDEDHASKDKLEYPLVLRAYPALRFQDIDEGHLETTLRVCSPPSRIESVGELLHYGRLWGLDDDCLQDALGGESAKDVLLRTEAFEKAFETHQGPLLGETLHGARYRELRDRHWWNEVNVREGHIGQCLSTLAEAGVPLSAEISTPHRDRRLRDVLCDLVANYNEEIELDWVGVALALYLPPRSTWKNKYGQTFTFDRLAAQLVQRKLGRGSPCGGTHTLYTFAVLLQANQRHPILSDSTEQAILNCLDEARGTLEASQLQSGAWDADWAKEAGGASGQRTRRWSDLEEFSITGHHLEWMGLVRPALRVSKPCLVRAARFVCDQTASVEKRDIVAFPCGYTHGVRGLSLLIEQECWDDVCAKYARKRQSPRS